MTQWVGRWMLLVAAMTMAGGCALTPEAKKARHLRRADAHFEQKKFKEAVLEYRNVLKYERQSPRALERIGLAHFELGEMGQAFSYLTKARAVDASSVDVRLRLATLYVLLRQPEKARPEAAFVLEKEPDNFQALVVMAECARTQDELELAIQDVEKAGTGVVETSKLQGVLGTLYLRKPDLPRAERAFRAAVAADPKSVESHLALARVHLGKPDLPEAERALKQAAAVAPPGSPAQVALADFYLQNNRRADGIRVLTETTMAAPAYLPAWVRLAQIAFDDRRFDDSLGAVEVVLKKVASHPQALLLRGRIHLVRKETGEAIEKFQKALKFNPRFVEARYWLARAHAGSQNVHQARTELQEAQGAIGVVGPEHLKPSHATRRPVNEPCIKG